MAEPRYQPAPRQRPSPYGQRPPKRVTAPKPAGPKADDQWWTQAPVAAPTPPQAQPSQSEPQEKWWTQAPVVEEKEPTFYEEYVKPTGEAIAGAGQAVKDWAVGKHDPRFAGLPSIDEPEVAADAGLQFGALERAKVAGFSDASYRDILRKQLGDRYLGETQDENGFTVLHYRGQDGKQASAYVNKPGVDYRDIDRGVNSTLPYLAAAGAMGRLTQGLNLGLRAGGQFLAGGG
ncbi:MAG TPA: hypothetical protein DCG72_02110, partial [Gammaproteobacteria bacterium]|nr:hypothetical protein [Gammaproteobacteria bacterium]